MPRWSGRPANADARGRGDGRRPRWCARAGIALATTSTLVLAWPAAAEERRLDLFDRHGRRTGHVVIDQQGRIDVYDAKSRRTGYGRTAPDGTVELFDPRGRRQGEVRAGEPGRRGRDAP